MNDFNLTKASILRNNDLKNLNLSFYLFEIEKFKKQPYSLMIYSKIENYMRFSIYPVEDKRVIKISIWSANISDDSIKAIEILKKFNIIHTSGILMKQNEFFYECYLNLRLSDNKTKFLKDDLSRFQNIFKEIIIEEICLK